MIWPEAQLTELAWYKYLRFNNNKKFYLKRNGLLKIKCIEQSNCPTLYKAGLCSEKQTGVECCFCPTEDHKFSQDEADKIIKAADINVSSSHHCTDRQNSTCTSLDQIRCKSIVGIINFRDRSNCTVTITGGTEVGHMNATQSHYTGFKFDIRMNVCVNTYITSMSLMFFF